MDGKGCVWYLLHLRANCNTRFWWSVAEMAGNSSLRRKNRRSTMRFTLLAEVSPGGSRNQLNRVLPRRPAAAQLVSARPNLLSSQFRRNTWTAIHPPISREGGLYLVNYLCIFSLVVTHGAFSPSIVYTSRVSQSTLMGYSPRSSSMNWYFTARRMQRDLPFFYDIAFLPHPLSFALEATIFFLQCG